MTTNTLSDLIERQVAFDEQHGFLLSFPNNKDRYQQISKDLIGIFGEIGEFSNLVKKINLKLDYHSGITEEELVNHEVQMREELADIFIYLIRLARLTNTDLESEYLDKQTRNIAKYANFNA